MKTSPGESRTVLFLVALSLEASALLEQLPFQKEEWAGIPLYRCSRLPFALLRPGMGAPSRPEQIQALLTTLHPQWVVNIGFAGALDPELTFGEPFIITEAKRCAADGAEVLEPIDRLFPGLAWRKGTICTMDAPVTSERLRTRLRRSTGAELVDMECFHLARLAHRTGLPFSAVKVVSDFADYRTAEVFRNQKAVLKQHLSTAFQTLVNAFKEQ